jgi:hypothetical protein
MRRAKVEEHIGSSGGSNSNMDVNRDYGIVRAGMRRGAEETEKSGVEERATLCAFALIEGHPKSSEAKAAPLAPHFCSQLRTLVIFAYPPKPPKRSLGLGAGQPPGFTGGRD